MIDGSIAGYGWLSTRPEWIGELQLEITPDLGEAYIWNCVTLAEHRRKGIFRALLSGIRETATAEGMKRLWIGSVAIPAEKAVGPAGFRAVLRFNSMTVVGMHLLSITAVEPETSMAAFQALSTRARLLIRRSQSRRH